MKRKVGRPKKIRQSVEEAASTKKRKRKINQTPEFIEARRQQWRKIWDNPENRARLMERQRIGREAYLKKARTDPAFVERCRKWGEDMKDHPPRVMGATKENHTEAHAEHLRSVAAKRAERLRKDPEYRNWSMRGVLNLPKENRSAAVKAGNDTRRGFKVPKHLLDNYRKIMRSGYCAHEAGRMLGLV